MNDIKENLTGLIIAAVESIREPEVSAEAVLEAIEDVSEFAGQIRIVRDGQRVAVITQGCGSQSCINDHELKIAVRAGKASLAAILKINGVMTGRINELIKMNAGRFIQLTQKLHAGSITKKQFNKEINEITKDNLSKLDKDKSKDIVKTQ